LEEATVVEGGDIMEKVLSLRQLALGALGFMMYKVALVGVPQYSRVPQYSLCWSHSGRQ
jgi:hypothetical protein